jgi:hypothetical protein
MRTEALVYAAVAVAGCALVLWRERGLRAGVIAGASSSIAFAVPWMANRWLELALGGNDRGGRVAGAASSGLTGIGDRLREVGITFLAVRSDTLPVMVGHGALVAVVVGCAVVGARRPDRRLLAVGLIAAFALHLVAMARGLGFVPGLLAASPLAIIALLGLEPRRSGRYVQFVALLSLPLVWTFQFVGGALPQWGGRYTLPSAILLVTIGASALPGFERPARLGLAGLALVVTASGVGWLHQRSTGIDRAFATLVELPEDVVISTEPFLIREGGARYVERRWLTAEGPRELEQAAGVVEAAGLHTFVVLDREPEARQEVGEGHLTGTTKLRFLSTAVFLHSYRLTSP